MDRAKIIVKNQINIINNNSQHGQTQNITGMDMKVSHKKNSHQKVDSSPMFEMYKTNN